MRHGRRTGAGRVRTEGNGCREFDVEIGVSATFGLLGAVLCHLAGAGRARTRETVVENEMVELVFCPHLASWGLSWVMLGLSWAALVLLGPVLLHLGLRKEGNGCRELDCEIGVLAIFGFLGIVLGHLGPVLGFSWVILGLSCPI